MIQAFLASKIGIACAIGATVLALVGVIVWRAYSKGASVAKAEQVQANLERVLEGQRARLEERRNPTDEDTDPFNRARPGR